MVRLPKTLKIPRSPGVYFFKDKNKKIIYIGKAADLRNRLCSYFSKSIKNARILNMINMANNIEWQETSSEIEALILESQLIKKHRPKFNILMRDDKQYFYVVFTKEIFPKIFLTHQPKSVKEFADSVGPFTDGTALKTTLKILRRIFPYCTCKQTHHSYCLNYHLENCPGYCCLKDESRIMNYELGVYQKNIKAIKDILSGKRTLLTKQLEKEMFQTAKNNEFIKAIGTRNKLKKLKWVFENAKILRELQTKNKALKETQIAFGLPASPRRIEAYDISNIQGTSAVGSMVVFTDGQPDKSQYRKFKIRSKSSSDDIAMLKEVLSRRFKHQEWQLPDLIIIDGGKAQLNAASSIVPKQIQLIALTKNKKHQADHVFTPASPKPLHLNLLTPDVRKLIIWANSEAHRFAVSYYRKIHHKTFF
ncbi:MAG: GIY-YIG nuclease family protein [Candidatus Yanofskybacteria bacterium]|nr:GIY-YIG nuclease family protein [Candidatus Yanofskybacteria bacterium]